MDPVHIQPLPRRLDGDELVLEAALDADAPGVGRAPAGALGRLEFRVPAGRAPDLLDSDDALVVASLFRLMVLGRPARVHGRVSPRLLAGLEEIMGLWRAWLPQHYRPVEIAADEEREAPPSGGPFVMAFSGGLDSCYSAWRHRRGDAGRRRRDVRAGVFARGLESRLLDRARFEPAARRNREILEDIGMELIPVYVNHRQFHGRGELAFFAWGSSIVAVQMLFGGRYGGGLVAGSAAYSWLSFPNGSHPVSDHLYSTAAFEVVHDAAEVRRVDKALAVARWPAAMERLRVCFFADDEGRNCGRCPKCVRTVLGFRVHGIPRPPCMPSDPTDAELRALPIASYGELISMRSILSSARARGMGRESWVAALRWAVWRYECRRVASGIRRRLRQRLGERKAGPAGGPRAPAGGRARATVAGGAR